MGQGLAELYDLVVVGSGVAGATAAWRAARQSARVLLLGGSSGRPGDASAGWLGPAGVKLARACGLTPKAVGAATFSGLRLHSWDLKRSRRVDDRELHGWLVNCGQFEAGLWEAASDAGACGLPDAAVEELGLGEERAVLRLGDGRKVSGRVVLIADGCDSAVAHMAHLPSAARQPTVAEALFADYQTSDEDVGLEVVIGASRLGNLATIMRLGRRASVRFVVRDSGQQLGQQFQLFCQRAAERGLLPAVEARPVKRIWPAGVALDMETHVGKRCLLIGPAGGFVAAFSQEELYPAMRSGWIAADAALRALKAPVLQDELALFGEQWRQELADYMRMPNTDLSLLVPLIFSNERMSRRVARAFLLGQPF